MSLSSEAFRRLYEAQQPLLTRQLRRQYPALADEVDDVVQDSFDKLWRHCGLPDGEVVAPRPALQDPGGWIFRTATNAMIDRTRMQKRRPSTDIAELEATATTADRVRLEEAREGAAGSAWTAEVFDDGDAVEDPAGTMLEVMHAVLPRLTDRDRVLLTLKYIDGLSYEQIAPRVGLSAKALGTTLLRARRAAQALIAAELAQRAAASRATRGQRA